MGKSWAIRKVAHLSPVRYLNGYLLTQQKAQDTGILILIVCKDTKKNRIMQVISRLSAHFHVIKHLITVEFDINQYKVKRVIRNYKR